MPHWVQVDTLYHNAIIWRGLHSTRDANSLAVTNGKIVAVGDFKQLDHIKAKTVMDLNGGFLMAGFADNHVHFMEGGFALASVDLRAAQTRPMFIDKIAEFINTQAANRWILNGNWDHQLWGGQLPHRDWIDSISPRNPVYLIRIDGHIALVNSLALKLAGIDESTPVPAGGEIQRDANGRLTGILKGNALNLVLDKIPQPSDAENLEAFALAQQHALSLGLVKIHALTAYPTETTMLDIFQLAKRTGLMKIRAFVSTPIESWQTTQTQVQQNGRGDAWLSWGGIKGFIDGSLGASTAWLYQAYSDDANNLGLPLNDPQQLKTWIQQVDEAGLRLAIHALGDRGIDTVIDIFKSVAGEDIAARRFRIEHFQHPTKDAINELAQHNIIASMQPYHAIDDGRWAQSKLGAQRIKTAYAFRTILAAGVPLSFGSDWPVAPLSPMLGVYAAVTRRTTDDRHRDGWQPQRKNQRRASPTCLYLRQCLCRF